MGKLHRIRKAFEQLPEVVKKDIAKGDSYKYIISFDKKGRATICQLQLQNRWCRHYISENMGLSARKDKDFIDYQEEAAHKNKRPYYLVRYLRLLALKYGYSKKDLKPYTRYERWKINYTNNRPEDLIKHKAST